MVLVQTRFGGVFIACNFCRQQANRFKIFLTPDFPLFKGPFEADPARYSERLTRAGGIWLFPTRLALRSIGSIKG
ncbi:hypothetical protein CCL11_17070 [Pseudomonas syringae]|nr:hypothetical protein CCL11_17070 [Pseudomonas syringae]